MSLVKFEVAAPVQMASVLTTEFVEDLDLKEGDADAMRVLEVGK